MEPELDAGGDPACRHELALVDDALHDRNGAEALELRDHRVMGRGALALEPAGGAK